MIGGRKISILISISIKIGIGISIQIFNRYFRYGFSEQKGKLKCDVLADMGAKKFRHNFLAIMYKVDLKEANETVQDTLGAKFVQLRRI